MKIRYNNIEFYRINNFNDYYISKCGKVLSTKKHHGTNMRILKPNHDKDGYLTIRLYTNKKEYNKKVHRLIGLQFMSNPDNKPQINHIDGDKQNNCVENLEWVTPSENELHSYQVLGKISAMSGKFGKLNPLSKKVNQYTKEGKFIKTWDSISDVQRKLKIATGKISSVCLNNSYRKSAGGFKWGFTNEY